MKEFITFIFLSILILANTPVLADTVVYNTQTHKYHTPSCQWAKKCTKNCIKIDRQKAIRNGGKPCKVCGGG